MVFLVPAAEPDASRPIRQLLLILIGALAVAAVLALLPKAAPRSAPIAANIHAPEALQPVAAPPQPLEVVPAPTREAARATTLPATRKVAPKRPARPVIVHPAAPVDDLSEDAAAAGLTSRTDTVPVDPH
jgi:hypothetical protein